MKDITEDFGTLYQPTSALVFYQSYDRTQDTYVEHFDMDKDGNPINAHPLTERSKDIGKSINAEYKKGEKPRISKTKRSSTDQYSSYQYW